MSTEELHPAGEILDLSSSEYSVLPDEPTLLIQMHSLIENVGTRFASFKEELSFRTAAERAVLHDLRPDRFWHQFWSERIPRTQRTLISAYAAGMLGGMPAEMMSAQRAAAEAYSPQNVVVYNIPVDKGRTLFDPQDGDFQDENTGDGSRLFLPLMFQPIQREPASPPPPRPSPSATLTLTPEGPPSSTPPPKTEEPPSPSSTPPPKEPTPTRTPERGIESLARVPLLSGIARIENPGGEISSLPEEWEIAGSGIRTLDPVNRGRVVSLTAADTLATPTQSTRAPNDIPPTEAAQIFIVKDNLTRLLGPIFYEGGFWYLGEDRLAAEPGSVTEDPGIEIFYYIDNRRNLQVEFRGRNEGKVLGNLSLALSQEGEETVPDSIISARGIFQPNGGAIKDVAIDELVELDIAQERREVQQAPLKDVLANVGAGNIYLFEGEMPYGEPLDSDGEYHNNAIHNRVLSDPSLLSFFEDGRANGIVWREEQGDLVQHYGGIDQMKAIADQFGVEMFVSSGHQFRSIPSWARAKIIKSERNDYRDFVTLVKTMLKDSRQRFRRQDNLNPMVIDRPLSKEGERGVLPNDEGSYEHAFDAHPQYEHAPGPMMEFAADAAPKGKNEEWQTKFTVFEASGLSDAVRWGKLKRFFAQFGLDKAKVPKGSYVLIIDEFMEDEGFFNSAAFKARLDELKATNPNVRIMIGLRPLGHWTYSTTPEQLATAVDPVLKLLLENDVDLALQRKLMNNPLIEARIRELAEERAKVKQTTPTPTQTPSWQSRIPPGLILPTDWRPREPGAVPRKPKGIFERKNPNLRIAA